jgi:isopentenyldiphosphate isomerase
VLPGSSETELLDVLRPSGLKAGYALPKNRIHREGLWHATVHLWVCDPSKGLLCQKRAESKSINPGLWDFSAAGHIGAGEAYRQAAVRELSEEVNLNLHSESLNYQGVYISNNQYSSQLIDREFNHIYTHVGKIDASRLRAQQEEVADWSFLTPEELKYQWKHCPQKWVRHSVQYYKRLRNFVESSAND